jgi:DNA-binding Lrp family transcriptional regulator
MYNINNHKINIIEIILILENRSRLAYYNERIDLLQQMFLSMQEVFSQNYLKNFINSLQNLRNQLINESTQENDVATIKTIQVIKTNGRPRYEISKDLIVSLAEHHFTWVQIANLLGISIATLNRRRRELNISNEIRRYSTITDNELDILMRRIKHVQPFSGESIIYELLISIGYKIQRQRIRESIHRIDPIGPAVRWSNFVERQPYKVAGPNSLWHNDGTHSLIRWKFIIHAFIDGYSRAVTGIKCSTNNRAETVLHLFDKAISQWGIPHRCRGDRGGENIQVAEWMINYRGMNRGSYIFGKSIHNQRIERLWRDVYRLILRLYYDVFNHLEREYGLDPNNEIHLWCLHYAYLPIINRALDIFQNQWNHHPLSTEHNQSPYQLFLAGMISCGARGILDERPIVSSEINIDENEYGIEWNGPTPLNNDENVELININCPLTNAQYLELQSIILPLETSDNYGIEIYLQTLSTVQFMLNN